MLEYKKKMRVLRVRMLDGAVKTLHVDDSHTVGQLMITICSKIGEILLMNFKIVEILLMNFKIDEVLLVNFKVGEILMVDFKIDEN